MAIEIHKTAINTPEIQSAGPLPNLKGVYLSHARLFFASQQEGTGSPQNIAHGLGVAPAGVIAIPTDGGTLAYGTHTATNVVLTCTTAKHFDVLAWL
jgi:hypothetical protein